MQVFFALNCREKKAILGTDKYYRKQIKVPLDEHYEVYFNAKF